MAAERRFDVGCEIGATTHGHPSGYLAAGFLSSLVGRLLDGRPLEVALDTTMEELVVRPHHEECLAAIESAILLARAGAPTAEKQPRNLSSLSFVIAVPPLPSSFAVHNCGGPDKASCV